MITREFVIAAAWFIEGEGHIGFSASSRVTANQVNLEPLIWLRDGHPLLKSDGFGGRISFNAKKRPNPIYTWQVVGTSAVGVIFTIYPWLSAKRREQARRVIERWRLTGVARRYKTHCPRGHAYAIYGIQRREKRKDGKVYRGCRICDLWRRAQAKRRYNARLRVVKSNRQGELGLSS